MPDDKRTLEIRTQHDGVFQVDIPREWRVTFSKVNPQAGGYECMALRIYESDERQRACFTNVISFRDVAIPLRRRVRRSTETVKSESGRGRSKVQRKRRDEFEWIDSDSDESVPF